MMDGHALPLAIGVIRDVEAPTYDACVAEQTADVTERHHFKTLRDMVLAGSTWEVK